MPSAARSCSKLSSLLSAGFLSNHFGASSSAAMPDAGAAVGEADPGAGERLRRPRERDHAEAERHAQDDVALEQVDRLDLEAGCGGRAHSMPRSL